MTTRCTNHGASSVTMDPGPPECRQARPRAGPRAGPAHLSMHDKHLTTIKPTKHTMHQTLTTTPTPITPPPAGTTSLTSGARLTPAFLNAQHPEATPPHTHQDTKYTRSLKLTQTDRSRKLAPHSPCLRAGLGVWSTQPAKKTPRAYGLSVVTTAHGTAFRCTVG